MDHRNDRRGPRQAHVTDPIPPAHKVGGGDGRGDPKGVEYRRAERPRYAGYHAPEKPGETAPQGLPEQPRPQCHAAAHRPAVRYEELPENMLVGRNPIREALRSGAPVEKLVIAAGDLSGAAREILSLAKEKGVVVQQVERGRLDALYSAHQGMIAYVAQKEYSTLEEILDAAREAGEDPFLIVLDGITDPHNLGAILRSADCAGAHGVIIPERRSCGLTPTVMKAAAGSALYMKVARVPNLNRTLEELKQNGIWTVAAALEGEDAFRADLTGPIALVIGSEGDGISRLTLEKCDRRVTLPMKGHIDSLNASVAAGILLFRVMEARRAL